MSGIESDSESKGASGTTATGRTDGHALALRWLTRRAHGERELARKLEKSGVATGKIETILARCRDLGYLNDRAFAASRARLRRERGWGDLKIRAELRALGVGDAWIEAALHHGEDGESDADPVAQARRVLEKRFGPPDGWESNDWRARQKRYLFLLRRGFDPESIEQAVSGRE
ncbi:MAG: recombination regulator RecX [Magnetococcus sp. YQC-9]